MVFSFLPFLFFLFFVVFLLILPAVALRAAKQNIYNRSQPVLSVSARVLSRRTNLGGHGSPSTGHSINTSYYVTFEVESGDRLEFALPGTEFGLLVEGDYGKLTFKGTKYLGFVRDTQQVPFHETNHTPPTESVMHQSAAPSTHRNQTYPDS